MRDSKPPAGLTPWALAGLGVQFFAVLLLAVYAGNWLDRRLGTAPFCLLAGVCVGGGGVMVSFHRRLSATAGTRKPTGSPPQPPAPDA